jgi:hypothetical protein
MAAVNATSGPLVRRRADIDLQWSSMVRLVHRSMSNPHAVLLRFLRPIAQGQRDRGHRARRAAVRNSPAQSCATRLRTPVK